MERQERGSIDAEQWTSIDALMLRMTDLRALSNRIKYALRKSSRAQDARDRPPDVDEPPLQRTEPSTLPWRYEGAQRWIINPGYVSLAPRHALLQSHMLVSSVAIDSPRH
jgi:hypothetical protein